MASDSASPPKGGGLSLYAHLLDPSGAQSSTSATASQQFNDGQEQAEAAKKPINSAFRFQPTKRPQLQAKAKPKKPAFAPPSSWANSSSSLDPATAGLGQNSSSRAQPVLKTSLSDWIGGDDDDDLNDYYAGERRQRGGRRKKKKKHRESDHGSVAPNWDAIYDFTRPTTYEEYKGSMEEFDDMLEWKHKLKAHRMRRESPSSDEEDQPKSEYQGGFAPPGNYSFAPPEFNGSTVPARTSNDAPDDATGEEAWMRRAQLGGEEYANPQSTSPPPPPPPPPPLPPADIPNDPTGEDAYIRRMRMSGVQGPSAQSESQSPRAPMISHDISLPPAQPTPMDSQPVAEVKASKPAGRSILEFATISSAAIHYEAPQKDSNTPSAEIETGDMVLDDEELAASAGETLPDADTPEQEEPERSSNRPGQKGFAERYMAKFGYTKGSGLGATGSGILTPLMMKAEKRKRLPDSEGGGFVDRGGRGKIVGGKKAKVLGGDDEGKYGKMSEIMLLQGMLNGKDLQKEIEDGLYQRIGDRCSKYGTIERIYIDQTSDKSSAPVFIKYTNPVSALGAVNAMDGQEFEGNVLVPRFFDADKFEKGIYE